MFRILFTFTDNKNKHFGNLRVGEGERFLVAVYFRGYTVAVLIAQSADRPLEPGESICFIFFSDLR